MPDKVEIEENSNPNMIQSIDVCFVHLLTNTMSFDLRLFNSFLNMVKCAIDDRKANEHCTTYSGMMTLKDDADI